MSSHAIMFNAAMQIKAAQAKFPQHFLASGWVEHAAAHLWDSTLRTGHTAFAMAGILAREVAAIGIPNQPKTTLVWDRVTGARLYGAIVLQDRRSADYCPALRETGHSAMITARTGPLADLYFSGIRLRWILDTVDGAREPARRAGLWYCRQLPDLETDGRGRM
jgi:glycerol kinase